MDTYAFTITAFSSLPKPVPKCSSPAPPAPSPFANQSRSYVTSEEGRPSLRRVGKTFLQDAVSQVRPNICSTSAAGYLSIDIAITRTRVADRGQMPDIVVLPWPFTWGRGSKIAKLRLPPSGFATPAIRDWIADAIGDLKYEVALILCYDRAGRFCCQIRQTGHENVVIVDFPETLRTAASVGARYLIIAHNHPSGAITPSIQDFDAARKMVRDCRVVGMRVIDCLILAPGGRCLSFRDAGYM